MPAVNPNWLAETKAVRMPESKTHLGLAQPGTTRLESACRCGRRRPIGVLLGMRSGARPRLEGQWYCRKQCLQEALAERARRDFSEDSRSGSRVQHRVPLGLLLQARGVVTAAQLQIALRLQAGSGCRLGDILRGHLGVAEEQITGAIAAQWGLPVLHLPSTSSLPVQSLAPARLFQASDTVPVERTMNGLLLACAEGPDPALALALERMYPLRVEFGVVNSSALDAWRESHMECAIPVQRVRCADREMLAAEAAELLFQLQPVASRMVRVNGMWWLRMWLEEAARHEAAEGAADDTLDVLLSIS